MKSLLRALVSNQALEQLYKKRQATRPSEENRTPVAMVCCVSLFALVLTFLMLMAWSRQDVSTFVDSQPDIVFFESQDSAWRITRANELHCGTDAVCYSQLVAMLDQPYEVSDEGIFTFTIERSNASKRELILLRRSIHAKDWRDRLGSQTLVLSFPQLHYERAAVYLNETRQATFLANSPITMQLDFNSSMDEKRHYTIDLVLELAEGADSLVNNRVGYVPKIFKTLSVMPLKTHQSFQEFVASDRAARGDFIGMLARVVMAVFVLALFILVDGSPETLGLALFLGFEAFAISLRFNWLPIGDVTFLTHYAYQMGDIMRLYFFLQLARMIDKRVGGWLFWGSVLSIPYGILRVYTPEFDLQWALQISRHRDTIVGFLGVVICARAAWYLKNRQVPWRVTALVVAGLGSFEQIVDPIGMLLPDIIYYSRPYVALTDILQPMSAWLFSLAAFINISTLETRVRTLTRIESKAQEIRRDMELGKSVQQTFFNLPELPKELQISCHNEAVLYVSGDTYFVDWSEKRNKLTFLINDVTGHGVQAALKASGVNVIANTIWLEGAEDKWRQHPLVEYATLVDGFFRRNNHNPDLLAMGGCEFDPSSGKVLFLRMNFPFPIIIEPKNEHRDGEQSRRDDLWRVELLALDHKELTAYQLRPGGFVILTSDGYLDGSKKTSQFLKYLRQHVGKQPRDITIQQLRQLVLGCSIFAEENQIDDRTFTIFKWNTFVETSLGSSTPPRDQTDNASKWLPRSAA